MNNTVTALVAVVGVSALCAPMLAWAGDPFTPPPGEGWHLKEGWVKDSHREDDTSVTSSEQNHGRSNSDTTFRSARDDGDPEPDSPGSATKVKQTVVWDASVDRSEQTHSTVDIHQSHEVWVRETTIGGGGESWGGGQRSPASQAGAGNQREGAGVQNVSFGELKQPPSSPKASPLGPLPIPPPAPKVMAPENAIEARPPPVAMPSAPPDTPASLR